MSCSLAAARHPPTTLAINNIGGHISTGSKLSAGPAPIAILDTPIAARACPANSPFAVDLATTPAAAAPARPLPLPPCGGLSGTLPCLLPLRHGRPPALPRRLRRRGLGAPPVTRAAAPRRPGSLPTSSFTQRSYVPLRQGPSGPSMLGFLHGPDHTRAPTPTAPALRAVPRSLLSNPGHVPMVTLRPVHGPDPDAPKRPLFDHLVTSPRIKPALSGPGPIPDSHGHVPTSRIGPAPPA